LRIRIISPARKISVAFSVSQQGAADTKYDLVVFHVAVAKAHILMAAFGKIDLDAVRIEHAQGPGGKFQGHVGAVDGDNLAVWFAGHFRERSSRRVSVNPIWHNRGSLELTRVMFDATINLDYEPGADGNRYPHRCGYPKKIAPPSRHA
jgi:hypothetical protein